VLVGLAPDVALCDIGLPGMSGIEGVRRFKALLPGLDILMLTVFGDDDHVFEAVCAGASGYLLKDTPPERLVRPCARSPRRRADVARDRAQGRGMFARVAPAAGAAHRLTERELELLQLLRKATATRRRRARSSSRSTRSASHVRNVYSKLHVHSKSEAWCWRSSAAVVR
jgi:DNA-binding NarL/FixJ family response regulator